MRTIMRIALLGLLVALVAAGPTVAQDKLKIGFITTLSGPQGAIGEHMKNSVELALDHLDVIKRSLPTEEENLVGLFPGPELR